MFRKACFWMGYAELCSHGNQDEGSSGWVFLMTVVSAGHGKSPLYLHILQRLLSPTKDFNFYALHPS